MKINQILAFFMISFGTIAFCSIPEGSTPVGSTPVGSAVALGSVSLSSSVAGSLANSIPPVPLLPLISEAGVLQGDSYPVESGASEAQRGRSISMQQTLQTKNNNGTAAPPSDGQKKTSLLDKAIEDRAKKEAEADKDKKKTAQEKTMGDQTPPTHRRVGSVRKQVAPYKNSPRKYPRFFDDLKENKKTSADYEKLQKAFIIDFTDKDSKSGLTPLMIAAKNNNFNLALYIVSKIPLSAISAQDTEGNTALMHGLIAFNAIQKKPYNKDDAKKLGEHNLAIKDARKIVLNLIDKTKEFENGSGFALINKGKQTVTSLANATNDAEIIKALGAAIDACAQFEKEHPKPKISVFEAAKTGNYSVFKEWMETHKINPNVPKDTQKNKTLLIIVAKKIDKEDKLLKEREQMIDDLLEAGADAGQAETEFGNTALLWILESDFKGKEEALKSIALKLIEHMDKKALDVQNKMGDSALHILARNKLKSIPQAGQIDLINAIAAKGASTTLKNSKARRENTPLGVATDVYKVAKDKYEDDQARLKFEELAKSAAKVAPPDDTIVELFKQLGEQ